MIIPLGPVSATAGGAFSMSLVIIAAVEELQRTEPELAAIIHDRRMI